MQESASKIVSDLDWDTFDESTLIGDLNEVYGLIRDDKKSNALRKLASITCKLKKTRRSKPIHSLAVIMSLSSPSDESTDVITSLQLFKFYASFFATVLPEKDHIKYFEENVNIIVVRRNYYQADKYSLEIVGALTFSRPRHGIPTYLAFMGVSDGSGDLAKLGDIKFHVLGEGDFAMIGQTRGFRGLGLGSLLLALMATVVTSFQEPKAGAPLCFLHYNANNEASAEGWLKHGFSLLARRSVEQEDDNTEAVMARYNVLVEHMEGCPVFLVSHDDTLNIATMFTRFDQKPDPGSEVAAWYAHHQSYLAPAYVATTPTGIYALNNEEIESKYQRRDPAFPDPKPSSLEENL
jgi:hypothetical protein